MPTPEGYFCPLVEVVWVTRVPHYVELLGEAKVTVSIAFFVGRGPSDDLPFEVGVVAEVVVPDVVGESGGGFKMFMAEGVSVVDVSSFEGASTAYILLGWDFVSSDMVDYITLVAFSLYGA